MEALLKANVDYFRENTNFMMLNNAVLCEV
jgi:hypothetical protein